MPELPEVETVMRGLALRLEGRRIRSAVLSRGDLRRVIPSGLAARLTGATVIGFRRRGKYILMRLAGGESLLIHLGMSGRMAIRLPGRAEIDHQKHEHLIMETEEGWRIGLIDPRRFGLLDLMPTEAEDAHVLLRGMGPEPLDEAFTVAVLSAALRGRRTPIKAALLDQRIVAGLGNIYVSEALFRAGISPRRLAGSVPGGACFTVGTRDQGHAGRSDRGRWLKPARLRPARWRIGIFSTCVEGLWPGGTGL
jgi:formamidopyrimidine-DNA glycosylase